MVNRKVGVYRKYLEPVPIDLSGRPVAKSDWPKKRAFCWVTRWLSNDGRRHSRSFKTKRQAQMFAAKKQLDIQDALAAGLTEISLRDFHTEHRQLTNGIVAPRTLSLHLATLASLAKLLGWDRSIHKISPREIEKFRATRLSKGIAPSTANIDIKILKRLFNLAILRGYIPKTANPCIGIPRLKVGSIHKEIIQPKIFVGIYASAPDAFWRAFLVTIYTAGIRLPEAINLTWSDIDFSIGRLHISRKKAVGLVQAWILKDHEMRLIPLPDQTVKLLVAWKSVAPKGCPYVFMEKARWDYYLQQVKKGSWRDGQDLVNNLLRRFKTICRRAGVGPYTIHDMRRSCITNWAGHLPVHVVQQLAGHNNIRTTQQYYLLVQPQDLEKARAIQASVLGSIPTKDIVNPTVSYSHCKQQFPKSA